MALRERLALPALLSILLIPAALAIFLLENFLAGYRELVLQSVQDRLPAIALRVEENLKSPEVLWNAFSREFGESIREAVTATSAPTLAEKVRTALGIPVRIFGFDENGDLVYPPGDFPDRSQFQDLNLAVQQIRFRYGTSSESVELGRRARQFCRSHYGQNNLISFLWARRFSFVVELAGESRRYLGVIGPVKPNKARFQSLLHLDVREEDIPPDMRFRNGLRAIPDDLPFGGFLASGVVTPGHAKGEPWFPIARLAGLPPTAGVEWHPEGIILKKRLDLGGGPFLCLAVPPPMVFRLPGSARHLLELTAVLLWFSLSHRLALILLGRRRSSVPLGRQIAFSFIFAGVVPFLTLAFVGASRFIEMESAERTRWEGRMQDHLVATDRRFWNHLENLQERCLGFTRALDLGTLVQPVPEQIPESLRDAHAIFFADARKPGFAPWLYSSMAASMEQALGTKADSLRKIVLDLFFQILLERGEAPASVKAGGKPALLTAQDILGESSPLLEMVKSLGTVIFSEFNTSHFASFCRLVEDSPRRARCFSFFIFDLSRETLSFLRRLSADPPVQGQPFQILAIHPDYGNEEERLVDVVPLREAVRRTRATQVPESVRLQSRQGQELLARTSFSRFLHSFYPVCLMPYAPILESRSEVGRLLIILFLAGFILIVGVSRILRDRLVLPLRQLREGAAAVAAGRFGHRLEERTRDELGNLCGAFNDMTRGLQERERLRRFVSRSTVEDIKAEEAGGGVGRHGRSVVAAILASDIRDFTTLSETQSADLVVSMLNDYFTAMDGVIQEEGGEIQKLVGDALVAVFHAEEGLPHPAEQAVTAGLSMRAVLRTFNRERVARGLLTVENGVGIHFSQVIEGKVGVTGGRQDFAVIGPAISRAHALEAASRHGSGTRVVVSRETMEAIGSAFRAVPLTIPEGDAFEVCERGPADECASGANPAGTGSRNTRPGRAACGSPRGRGPVLRGHRPSGLWVPVLARPDRP